MFTAEKVIELLKLSDEEFYQYLVDSKFTASKDDAKVFLLESLKVALQDPANEFPIQYFDSPIVPDDQKFVEFGGVALTDEFVDKMKTVRTTRGCTICCNTCEVGCVVNMMQPEEGEQITMEDYMATQHMIHPADPEAIVESIEKN